MHAARCGPCPGTPWPQAQGWPREAPSLLVQHLLQNEVRHLSRQSQLHKAPTSPEEQKCSEVSVPPLGNETASWPC